MLHVPQKFHKYIIGPKGRTIQTLTAKYADDARVPLQIQFPEAKPADGAATATNADPDVIRIRGTASAVASAKADMEALVADVRHQAVLNGYTVEVAIKPSLQKYLFRPLVEPSPLTTPGDTAPATPPNAPVMTLGLAPMSYKLQQEYHVRILLPVPSPVVKLLPGAEGKAKAAWVPVKGLTVSVVGVKKFVDEAQAVMLERAQTLVRHRPSPSRHTPPLSPHTLSHTLP